MSTPSILITGCQSGIGKATAIYFQKKGWNVAATMLWPEQARDIEESDNLKIIPLDVEDPTSISRAIHMTLDHFDRIDVLFNNAGFAVMGVFEAASETQSSLTSICSE
jgi:NAD(P)-dependent dehydrogenase (short-subunit alcohol dehydrogenase family)